MFVYMYMHATAAHLHWARREYAQINKNAIETHVKLNISTNE